MKLKGLLEDYSEYNVVDKKALLKLLEKPKPKTVYNLENEDEFWFLHDDGFISLEKWNNSFYHRRLRDMGNISLTEEETEKKRAYRECEVLLKRYANGYEWLKGNDNWYLKARYNLRLLKWEISIYWEMWNKSDKIYFLSHKEAEVAINKIGEKRLLIEYFKIPEDEL